MSNSNPKHLIVINHPPTAHDNSQAPDGSNAGVTLSDNDGSWSEEPPTIKNFPFTETPSMKVDTVPDAGPKFVFNLIFTENFVENLVKNTN